MVRAPPCHGGGRGFESLLGRSCGIDAHETYGILAQLGEHLPYKQRVIGSSPIGPTNQFNIDYAAVAELADAQDLKSCGANPPYRFDSGLRQYKTSVFTGVLFLYNNEKRGFRQYEIKRKKPLP